MQSLKCLFLHSPYHYNYYTQRNWKDLNNYDIAINVDSYGTKETANILAEFVNNISKETKGVIA